MNNQQQQVLENQIRASLGSAPAPDFESWKQKNEDTLDSLSQVQTQSNLSVLPRPGFNRWRIAFAVASTLMILATISWTLYPSGNAFAKTIERINVAKTVTWVRTSYERATSKDGKRKWLNMKKQKATYMSPGFFRYDSYCEKGEQTRTTLVDPIKKQTLTLYHGSQIFEIKDHEVYETTDEKEPVVPPKMKLAKLNVGPFGWFNRAVSEGGEVVGQRTVDGRKVNVLRWHNLMMGIHNPKNVGDVWIDAETKEVVGTSHPASSVFDPDKLDYRDNPPEDKFSRMSILGSITKEIELDPKVDPGIFEFKIPAGYTKAPQQESRAVTEPEMIEWVELLAKINDNQFVDSFVIENTKKIAESSQSNEPSELEKAKRKLWLHLNANGSGGGRPFWDFIEANTIKEDCMYLGKGVKLGDAEKPILIYRLKLTGRYRVVYGDMRIEDAADDVAEHLKIAPN